MHIIHAWSGDLVSHVFLLETASLVSFTPKCPQHIITWLSYGDS